VGDKTGISWTDATWAPARGCSRISEGCRNCYAERIAARFSDPGQPFHGFAVRHTAPRDSLDRVGGRRAGWTRKVELQPDQLAIPLRWKKGRRIFCSSMTDIFHENLTNEQIAAVFGVMAACPQHTFQVLTKRARRMREWFLWSADMPAPTRRYEPRPHACWELARYAIRATGMPIESSVWNSDMLDRVHEIRWPLLNVWLGVSVENQEAANERIPELLATPAAVRFLSCEPLIGEVDLHAIQIPDATSGLRFSALQHQHDDRFGQSDRVIDWVISGCESGPGARHCEVSWLRSLRDQCAAASVPFFLKQASCGCNPCDEFCPIQFGPGSKRKAGGVIELPYLYGVQHAAFPVAPSGGMP